MAKENFPTMAAYIDDLLTNRSKSDEGHFMAIDQALKGLAAEQDALQTKNAALTKQVAELQHRLDAHIRVPHAQHFLSGSCGPVWPAFPVGPYKGRRSGSSG